MTDKQVKGLAWASATTIISGVAVFANSLVVQGIDPMVHTTIKNGLVGMMLLIVLAVTGEWKGVLKLNRQQWVRLLLIALIGGSVSFALFFSGLRMIGASQGSLIHKSLILWIALMAVPLLKEKVSTKMVIGIVLLFGSNLIVGIEHFGNLGIGHAMVLGATILWAIENVIAKIALKEVPVNIVVTARMALGAVILTGLMMVSGKAALVADLNSLQWLKLAGVGILLFGYVMSWYRALKFAPATQVASVLVGASLITSVLRAIFVTHVFELINLLQAVVVVTGVWLVVMAAMDGWKEIRVVKPAIE